MKKIILFALLFINSFVYSQAFRCGSENLAIAIPPGCDYFQPNNNSYCMNIKFHIVRNTDQSGGLNPNQIPAILALLNLRYNPHNISFVSLGYDYINNSNYTTILNGSTAMSTMFNTYDTVNSLNYYIVQFTNSPDTVNGGIMPVAGLGGDKHCILPSFSILNEASTHEIGHCLGLLHTFECRYPIYDSSCAEIVNDPNCQTRGDKVCDTPADSNSSANGFNPDMTNIMSYYSNRNHFTLGQGLRMRNHIKCNLTGQRSHQCDIVSGPVNICPNNNYTYTLTTFGTPTVVWTSSPNLPINGSNSGLTVSVQPSANTSGQTGTVTATINGTIVKTFIVKIGLQITNNGYINGTYDWVSINYGPMGLIASGNGSIASYQWALTTESGYPPSCAPGNVQAKFANGSQSYSSTSPNVIVNWGSCKGSYILSRYVTTICGESLLYGEYITDVGDPRNNPCFTDALRAVIAPNPIVDGVITVSVSKTLNMMPCNFKTYTQTSIDYKMDEINNHVLVHDYNGNQIYEQYYE